MMTDDTDITLIGNLYFKKPLILNIKALVQAMSWQQVLLVVPKDKSGLVVERRIMNRVLLHE